MKKVAFWAVLTLLILFTSASSFNIRHVKAWSGDITIKSDGSVDPPTAPVSHSGNIYSLTDDVEGSIAVEEDNITVNGMGHAVQWTGTSPIGVNLGSRTNVTIINMGIEDFVSGVYLYSSSHNNISQNNITGNSGYGIYLYSSSNNNVLGNSITASSFGVFLDSSSNNNVSENKIQSNSEGVYAQNSPNNEILHNNFIDNTEQTHAEASANIWDAGYPSGGNYWSDYNGTDSYGGPYQNVTGSDGIGDTPYVIDGSNQDNYPLIIPHTPHDLAVIHSTTSRAVVGQGYSLNISVTVANRGDFTETFNVTAYANATAIQTRELALPSGNSAIIDLTWNTAGFAKGKYSTNAYAWPVPGETSTADNSFTGGWVAVSMVGDLTGGTPNVWDFVPDGKVGGVDVSVVSRCFGSWPGAQPPMRWEPNCDLNNNGHVDGTDVATAARHFGEADP